MFLKLGVIQKQMRIQSDILTQRSQRILPVIEQMLQSGRIERDIINPAYRRLQVRCGLFRCPSLWQSGYIFHQPPQRTRRVSAI